MLIRITTPLLIAVLLAAPTASTAQAGQRLASTPSRPVAVSSGAATIYNDVVLAWSYDDVKNTLAVTALYNGKGIGSAVLKPTSNKVRLQGEDGGVEVTLDLMADFAARQLSVDATKSTGENRHQPQTF